MANTVESLTILVHVCTCCSIVHSLSPDDDRGRQCCAHAKKISFPTFYVPVQVATASTSKVQHRNGAIGLPCEATMQRHSVRHARLARHAPSRLLTYLALSSAMPRSRGLQFLGVQPLTSDHIRGMFHGQCLKAMPESTLDARLQS